MKATQLFKLDDRIALVTGGGTGLGRQFALTLADAGATVILSGRRTAPLEDTAAAIRQAGGSAHCLALDISNPAAVETAFKTIESMGGIDVLVNNAGVGVGASVLDTTPDQWNLVMDANLKGAWLVARAAATRMIAQDRGGSIVNISSILGTAAQKGMGAYAASKAALSHLTRVMALEWARYRIRVNAIEPGYYMTDLSHDLLVSKTGQAMLNRIPQRRLGNPEELDGVLLLLASNASSYMTGSIVTVDGGLSMPVV
jgi:NAD(P)-dependent dehydrogenase (short-subunit alcohol dehydrogenase family)